MAANGAVETETAVVNVLCDYDVSSNGHQAQRSWTAATPSAERPPANWPATPAWCASSPAPPAKYWTSAARPGSGTPRSGGLSGTGGVGGAPAPAAAYASPRSTTAIPGR